MKMKRTKTAELTAVHINRRTKKQITAVVLAGLLLIAADTVTATLHRPDIVQSYGQLYIIRPEAGEKSGSLTLQAQVKGNQTVHEEKVNIILPPYEEKTDTTSSYENIVTMTEDEQISYEIRNLIDSLSRDTSIKKLQLPEKLESGEKISWTVDDTYSGNAFPIIIMTLMISFMIYKNRMLPLEKTRRNNQNSILKELPEFVNRLVLLLNAGLVLSTAFEKTIEEYSSFDMRENDYFILKLKEIYTSVTCANGSMHLELRAFARESGSKELMRISNIISENVNKGVELASKLQNESELLWLSRKKSCEERGRLAETKLTLPLVIFLIALIVITVAPAMLEL